MKSILPILILGFASVILCQTQTATTTDGKKVILKPDKTWEYVQEKPETIPTPKLQSNYKNFKGDNWDALKAFLKLHPYEKGEFETIAQFKARFETHKKTKMEVLNKNAEDTVVVGIGELVYDAQTQTFKPNLITMDVGIKYGPHLNFFTSPNFGGSQDRRIYLTFSVPPEKAKNKNNIRFAVYGTPIGNILSNIVPRKIVVFDTATGEVFKEFNYEN